MDGQGARGDGWRLVPLADRAGWDAALDGLPYPVATGWGFRDALGEPGGHPVSLFVSERPGGRFACAIAERSFAGEPDAYTPYGFGGVVGEGDAETFRSAWADAAAARGWVAAYLSLHPVLAPAALATDPALHEVGEAFVLDLDDGPEALLARMSSNARRSLRGHGELRAEIAAGTRAVVEFFVGTYPAFIRDRGAAAVYDLPPATLERLVRAPGSLLLGWPAERPVAAALFGSTRGGAEYLFAAELPDARGRMGHLILEATTRLRAAGVPWLHLGGGIRGHDGVAEFKRRLGGRPLPIRSLRLVHRPDTYASLSVLAGPGGRPGYFPAYHAPPAGGAAPAADQPSPAR